MLGQSETKRQQLRRALHHQRAGIALPEDSRLEQERRPQSTLPAASSGPQASSSSNICCPDTLSFFKRCLCSWLAVLRVSSAFLLSGLSRDIEETSFSSSIFTDWTEVNIAVKEIACISCKPACLPAAGRKACLAETCIDTTQSSTEPTWVSTSDSVQATAIRDTPLVPSQSSGSADEPGSEPEAACEGFPKNKRRKVQVQEQPAMQAPADDSPVQAEADRPQQLKDARLVAAAVKQGLGIPGQ